MQGSSTFPPIGGDCGGLFTLGVGQLRHNSGDAVVGDLGGYDGELESSNHEVQDWRADDDLAGGPISLQDFGVLESTDDVAREGGAWIGVGTKRHFSGAEDGLGGQRRRLQQRCSGC